MKIYVAAPWVEKAAAKIARTKLIEAGHICTSRWLDVEGSKTGMSVDLEKMKRESKHDRDDVQSSDALVLLNLQKRGEETSGKAVELGLAIAWGKKIVMVGQPTNVFHYLPEVTIVNSIEEAIEELKKCQLT